MFYIIVLTGARLQMCCCIRHKTSLPEAGQLLSRNAERHLLAPDEMARRWQGFEQALQTADEIAASCQFSLDDLRYDYPAHEGRSGRSAMDELTWQAREGSRKRYPDGVPDKVNAYLDKELALVRKMGYAPFFLTVFDIVRFARSRNILCQGRGLLQIQQSVIVCLSHLLILTVQSLCLNGLSARPEMSRQILMWILNITGAKRSYSIFITGMAGIVQVWRHL